MGLFNRNYVGTHFGGSLFSMTDPFYMLMLMHRLGCGHVVWDRAAKIDFLHPAKGTVTARFTLDDATIESVRAATAGGEKHLPVFTGSSQTGAAKMIIRPAWVQGYALRPASP